MVDLYGSNWLIYHDGKERWIGDAKTSGHDGLVGELGKLPIGYIYIYIFIDTSIFIYHIYVYVYLYLPLLK